MEYHSGGSLPLLGRPRYCPGAKAGGGYLCETGHCCGETGCCTYYYELWWFWLLWTLLILFSCCCAYRHRRAKLRVEQQQQLQQQQQQQQQLQQLQQRGSSLLAHHPSGSYPSSMLDLSFLASLKLPSYEEVAAQPSTPPPPYSSVFTTPRYPQPPRTSEPHLLTQHHGPLLPRRLSDGPSSFSSDNSSSCSCDSCCPSSLCSSSISAAITYETDTSHASTPGEATPLTLEGKGQNVAGLKERRFFPEGGSGPAEEAPGASDPLPTRSLLQHPPPTPTAEPTAAPQPVQAYAPGAAPAGVLIQIKSCEDPSEAPPPAEGPLLAEGPPLLEGPRETPAGSLPSLSGPSGPAFRPPDSPTSPLSLDLSRCRVGPGPVSEPPPMTAGSPGPPRDSAPVGLLLAAPSDQGPCLDPAMLNLRQAPGLGRSGFPTVRKLPQAPEETWSNTLPSPGLFSEPLSQVPDPAGLHGSGGPSPQSSLDYSGKAAGPPEPALTSPSSSWYQSPDLASDSLLVPETPNPGPGPGLGFCPGLSAAKSGPLQLSSQACLMVPPPAKVQKGTSPGPERGSFPGLGSGSGQLSTFAPALQSRPAITIQADSSGGSSPPSPPAPPSASLPATILLLEPFSGPQQASRGGSSSGHASSLSPSPRTTQSPPKQTLFSPCVDVFEPEPLSWEDGEEEQEEQEEQEEEEEEVGADESQYRRRRLTGDSGIEVCRCRVDEGGEGEGGGECKGRGVHGERDGRARGSTPLHDSVDCPARGQRQQGHTPTRPRPSEGAGKALIVMETV